MGKSSKHKTENVHHFLSFSERISNVNIDVIHRIRRVDDETAGTYFGEGLTKWTELDLTDHFCNFRKEISNQVQTYEQLVHHKEAIFISLKHHLAVKNTTALSALLDLLVQLSKDLQQDFVPHFEEIFRLLTNILATRAQDADAMEQTFQALASLFRSLWRFLIKDFKDVFGFYSYLLNSTQKDYIKVFAAESCAYLLRKVKKQDELLNFLLGNLKSSPELVDGIGLLLFEMVKGVQKHFHTISQQVFPLLLEKLGTWNENGKKQPSLPYELVESAVTTCMLECAEHTDRDNSKGLWDAILSCINNVREACSKEHLEKANKTKAATNLSIHLCRLLRVTSALINHNNGAIIADPQLVANTLCQVLPTPGAGSESLSTMSSLLTVNFSALSVDVMVKIMANVFDASSLSFDDLITFAMSCIDMPFFEKDVMPRMLGPIKRYLTSEKVQGLQTTANDDKVMTFLAEVVLHKTNSPITGDSLAELRRYPLDKSWASNKHADCIANHVESLIQQLLDKSTLGREDFPLLWSAVVCLPHIRINKPVDVCVNVWNCMLKILHDGTAKESESIMNILNQTFKSMIYVAQDDKLNILPVGQEDVYKVVEMCQCNPCAVQILNFYLSFHSHSENLTNMKLMERTYGLLENNLTSPSHKMRLLTCHILSLFSFEPIDYGDEVLRESVFKVMWKSESMVPTVHNYREKLIHLRKMEHDFAVRCLPSQSVPPKACLLFVLGNMFWDFKLLWEPVGGLVTSYAQSMDLDEFWAVMLDQLDKAATKCEKALNQLPEEESKESTESTLSDIFNRHCGEILSEQRKPDYLNFRNQLWKALKRFPEKCVLRSDRLCQLYLRFLRNEFNTADEDFQSFQSIAKSIETCGHETMEVDQADDTKVGEEEKDGETPVDHDDGDDEEDEADVSVATTVGSTKKGKKKSRVQSLLVHLGVFSLFKKQRAMFNQEDVQHTFLDFLKHRNPAIQKAGFDVILTYKSPHLLPYRENFLRLLDDKTFKSEITLFSLDEDNSHVKSDDREGLLPVLMRILYGKMHGKTGNDTAGKANSNIRRAIVFGFLGGCHAHELKYFLELLFQPCMHFVTDDPVEMVSKAREQLNLNKVIPLKRMKGILNTLQTVSRRWGHRLGDFSHSVLHMLLGVAAMLDAILSQRHLVVDGAVKFIKSLKHVAIDRVTQFCETFHDLDYTAPELEALFEAVVWPQAEKLVYEGVHHPTPLLKLMVFWSQHSRFIPLLSHPRSLMLEENKLDGTSEITALGCVLDLLNAQSVSRGVVSKVLEMLDNILKEDEDQEDVEEEGDKTNPLPSPFVLSDSGSDNLKPRDQLLVPHVPKLLKYLKHSLSKMNFKDKDKKSNAAIELNILARLSGLVTSAEDCQALCELLVPYLSRGESLSEEIEESTLISLTNLMQHIKHPEGFIKTIAQLFSVIERRQSRNLLCKLFSIICEEYETLKIVAALVHRLNAWDPRRAEEPDYLVRLAAFTEVNALVAQPGDINVNVLLPIIHNSCHFIHAIDDLSIRDNSTHCLVKLIGRLAPTPDQSLEDRKAFTTLLEQTLVPQVKLGIRSKSEAVRHEFLAVLQSLVIHCKGNVIFEGLPDLCDKDPDADFFENIRHIQIHKRSRALRRLYKHLKDHKFRASVHMSYILPLVYTFVTDSSYSKYANLTDAAVDLLGAVCRQLPWQYYLQTLKFYLRLLASKVDLQRQIIRIIVALLDAFHFDLKNSTFKVRSLPKAVQGANSNARECKEDGKDNKIEENGCSKETSIEVGGEELEAVEELFPEASDHGVEEEEMEVVLEAAAAGGGIEGDEVANLRMVVCAEKMATRIHKTISLSLIPQLHRIITQRAKSDDEHKLVKSKYPEDEEILRVPIALALIKLLQGLPHGTLEYTLPGILLKICNFLKSRSRDIRTLARETLEKVALSLGCRYVPFIIKEMRAVLTRGYQLHVLSFTVHFLLKSLVTTLQPGDLDPAVSSIQDVFYAELFGHVAEEKDVEAIRAKYFEAKFIKGYDAYGLLARCVSATHMDKLIIPVRSILESTNSQRIANKAETLLQKVAAGLSANPAIPLKSMMVFIHSLTVSVVQQRKGKEQQEVTVEQSRQSNKARKSTESCLLLESAAPRGGHKPKANKKTNDHLLVEFGLQLLFTCLKKESLSRTEHEHLCMLDPLVSTLNELLVDTHVKTSANSMRCLSWLLPFPLPSLKHQMKSLSENMFVVLQNYAGASTAKGGNQELITMCFKAVTVLVRDVTYHEITAEQLQVLLTYCEEDLYSHARQSTAFGLIRAILSRKLDTPQLHQVMERLFEMSITSQTTGVRLQSRQVLLHYLMNYPLGKKLKHHLQFFIDHLEYEVDDGRRSAIEMMIAMFNAFPTKILNNHCPRFFNALAMASFNDNDAGCRKLIAVALKTLIGKVDLKRRKTLFVDVLKWLKTDDLRVRAMGCQTCIVFVDVEGGKFQHYVAQVLPLIQQQLEPGRYSEEEAETEDESETATRTEQRDICLLALLTLTLRIVREIGVTTQPKFSDDFDLIWDHVSSHLLYPHVQVRLAASQLLGLMLSAWEPSVVVEQHQQLQENEKDIVGPTQSKQSPKKQEQAKLKQKSDQQQTKNSVKQNGQQKKKNNRKQLHDEEEEGGEDEEEMEEDVEEMDETEEESDDGRKAQCMLTRNPIKCIKKLSTAICQQLKSPSLDDPLATQAVKTLLYMARLAEALSAPETLVWLAKKVIKEVNMEVINNVKITIRRNHIFKWVAAVAVTLQSESVAVILPVVLPSLQRELSEQASDSELKTLTQEVTDMLKKQVGLEIFTSAYAAAQKWRLDKKDHRKRNIAEEAVTNPDIAARKKIRHNLKKRETRKRKIAEKKPHKRVKKNKLSILNVKVDEND